MRPAIQRMMPSTGVEASAVIRARAIFGLEILHRLSGHAQQQAGTPPHGPQYRVGANSWR